MTFSLQVNVELVQVKDNLLTWGKQRRIHTHLIFECLNRIVFGKDYWSVIYPTFFGYIVIFFALVSALSFYHLILNREEPKNFLSSFRTLV